MGRLIQGIHGPVLGKVGFVSGASWKGLYYIKGPHKKRTARVSAKEAANRKKFALSQSWLKPLLKFVRDGFKGYSPPVEGFVAAKSYLLRYAFEGDQPDIRINPALVRVSYGDLPLSNNISVRQSEAGKLQFNWDPARVDGGSQRDQVMLLAYDIEHAFAYFTTTGQFRENGVDTLRIGSATGRTYHVYLAFCAADRSRQSNSVYLGEITS